MQQPPLVMRQKEAQNSAMQSLNSSMFKTILRALIAAFALLWLSSLSVAQDRTQDENLDHLFAQLKVAATKPAADQIAGKIWRIWLNPQDKTLAARMNEIMTARTAFDVGQTLALLDTLVAGHPTYAEGWNRRATLHYALGNYQKSLADIQKTLQLEPRHFGALSGQALVYLALSDIPNARAAANRARAIHPFVATNPPLSELIDPRVRI